ncbi:MAG: hypothetical protein AB2N28_3270 [Candidatus Phytoplasma solani]
MLEGCFKKLIYTMKNKIKKTFYFLFILLFLFAITTQIFTLNAFKENNGNNKEIYFNDYEFVKKIKKLSPKFENNNQLLEKILEYIVEEIKFIFGNFINQPNLKEKLDFIEKYNIISEFNYSVQQTVSDIDKFILVLPGNTTEFRNFDNYLMAKNNKFHGSKNYSWSMWSPSNFFFLSKHYIIFLIENFSKLQEQEKKIKEKELEIQKLTNISQSEKEKLQKEINRQKESLKLERNKILSQAKIIEKQEHEIQRQKNQIKSQEEEIEKQINEVKTLKKDIEKKQNELNSNQKLSEQEKEKLQKEISTLQRQFESYRNKNNFLQKDIDQIKSNLETKELEIQKLTNISQSEKDKLQKEINQQKESLNSNQEQISFQARTIEAQENQIKSQKEEIEKQKNQIKSQEEEIKNQKSEIQAKNAQTNQLKQEISNKQNELDSNKNLSQQQQTQLKQEINALRQNINNNQIQIELLQQKMQATQNSLHEKELEIQQLTNISQIEKNELQQKIDAQKLLAAENQKNLNQLKQENNDFKNQIAQKDVTIKSQKEEIKNQNISISNLHDKVISAIEKNSEKTNHLFEITNQQISKLNEKSEQEEKNKLLNSLDNFQKFKVQLSQMPSAKDIIGFKKEIEQLQEFFHYLKNPHKYKDIGVQKPPKGVLLYGPPGTGKTFLAKFIAREVNLPFFALDSSHFSKTYVGEGPKLINDIFEQARKESPSIIFIDECETVFRSRASDKPSNSDHDNLISAFLSQTEGFETNYQKPIFLIGATNYKDQIDPAILSRFSSQIEINLLSKEDRKKFIKKLAKKYQIDIRGYQYLDQLNDILEEQSDISLKSQRKLTDILDQAGIKAVLKHDHLNILPIDLQMSLFRQIGVDFNWENHEHNAYSLRELENLKEYKGIEIKHLYKDTQKFDTAKEQSYFQKISYYSALNQQKVYNYNNYEIKNINFSKEPNKIQQYYGTLNFLPKELLGFYFVGKKNIKNIDIPVVNTLEEVLFIHKQNIKTIYFIWDINKIKANINFSDNLINLNRKRYPFLSFLEILPKIDILVQQKNTNETDIKQIITQYILETKKKIIAETLKEVTSKNNWFSSEETQKIISEITEEQYDQNHISWHSLKSVILKDFNTKIYHNQQEFIQKYFKESIDKININHPLFDNEAITNIKQIIKNKINQLYLKSYQLANINRKKMEETFTNIKNDNIYQMIGDQLQNKMNECRFNYAVITKSEIKNQIVNQIKTQLFQPQLSLEEFTKTLQSTIEEQETKIFNHLTEETLENVINSVLLKNNFEKSLELQEIAEIKAKTIFFLKKELKIPNINKNKFKQHLKAFIQNYPFQRDNGVLDYVKKNTTMIASIALIPSTFIILFGKKIKKLII